MAKHYKLSSKKKEADGRFYISCGLFYRYTATKPCGIVILILEILAIVLTSVFALCLGVFGSIFMGSMYDFTITDDMSQSTIDFVNKIAGYIDPANILWLVSSIVYIVGTLVLVLGFSRIAASIHACATAMTITSYSFFMSAHELMGSEKSPAGIMLPCIFITVVSIATVILVHFPKWIDQKNERDNAVAPSILSDKED